MKRGRRLGAGACTKAPAFYSAKTGNWLILDTVSYFLPLLLCLPLENALKKCFIINRAGVFLNTFN
jgi:hypothetical protein